MKTIKLKPPEAYNLTFVPEPALEFGVGQTMRDPRDGLSLFGPFEKAGTGAVSAGFIGTAEGLDIFKKWVSRIQVPIISGNETDEELWAKKPPYLGFHETFGISWNPVPVATIIIDPEALSKALYLDETHIRVQKVVDLFSGSILSYIRNEDAQAPNIWFIVIPDIVKKYCRPKSTVEASNRRFSDGKMRKREALKAHSEPFLLAELNAAAQPYLMAADFHNQLKASLLRDRVLSQIVLESTINYAEFNDQPTRRQMQAKALESQVAWNLSSAVYYKVGARPWRIANTRPGVCYIGLVFKQDELRSDQSSACCAAQMFLDSGDGVVFRGHVGPWYTGKRGEYHLSESAACEILKEALAAYRQKHDNRNPAEVFVHGRTALNTAEMAGFQQALDGADTKLVAVQISDSSLNRLYRVGEKYPVLRGTALIEDSCTAYLWTRGYIPRLRRYPGKEVPVPLRISVSGADVDLERVLSDVMGLTKLNYNSCTFADGVPVTLKFADAIGEILTTGRCSEQAPLHFRHYI